MQHCVRLLFLGLFSLGMALQAQVSLSLPMLPTQPVGALWQPAYLAEAQGAARFGTAGAFGLANNALTYAQLYLQEAFLDEATKDALISALGDDNRLQAGFLAAAAGDWQQGDWRIGLSYRYGQSFFYRLNNPQSLSLILKGNAQFAGQTVSDQDLGLRSYRRSEVGLAVARRWGAWQLGLRLRGILGHQFEQVEGLRYSLFTAQDGAYLDLSGSYQREVAPSGTPGWGLGLDLGAIYQVNEQLRFQLAAQDLLGFQRWNGYTYEVTFDERYEGVAVQDLFSADFDDGELTAGLDSLLLAVMPDSVAGAFTHALPATLSVGGDYAFGTRQVWLLVQWGLSPYAPTGQTPLVAAGIRNELATKWATFQVGLHGYAGGPDRYGLGTMARAAVPIGKHQLSLFYSFDNLLGPWLTEIGRGYAMQGGLAWVWGEGKEGNRGFGE